MHASILNRSNAIHLENIEFFDPQLVLLLILYH